MANLERLDEAKGFVNRAADRKIVHGDLAQHTLVVNDKEPAAVANAAHKQ